MVGLAFSEVGDLSVPCSVSMNARPAVTANLTVEPCATAFRRHSTSWHCLVYSFFDNH